LINTATLRFPIAQRDVGAPLCWAQVNYITSGNFLPGSDQFGMNAAVNAAFFQNLYNARLNFVYYTIGSMLVNTPTGTKVGNGETLYIPATTGTLLPVQTCIVLNLFSTNTTRRGRGIFRLAGLTTFHVDGDYVSLAARPLVEAVAATFITTFTYAGVTFTPAVWSRLDGAMYPINRVTITDRICRMHKRRPWRQKQNPIVRQPLNW
jgi:hypothetical protein